MNRGADLHLGAPLSNAQFSGEAVRAQAAVRTPQKWLLPHQPGGAGVLLSLGAPAPAHSASAAAGVELRSAGLKAVEGGRRQNLTWNDPRRCKPGDSAACVRARADVFACTRKSASVGLTVRAVLTVRTQKLQHGGAER